MKTRLACLSLLALLLPLAACGEIPTPGGAYPPPTNEAAGTDPPDQAATLSPRTRLYPVQCVDQPLDIAYCLPTPSEPEQAAVQALGLPTTIDFTLQWAIYRMQQQGTPNQMTRVTLLFDPTILSFTATVFLAGQHGMKVEFVFEDSNYISGIMALDAVPQLAAERGITNVSLKPAIYLDPPVCPTPGGPTPRPVTCRPLGP